MERLSVTTPFGQRGMSIAMVRGQLRSQDIRPDKIVDKWKIYRETCDARTLLGLHDRALAVLNALLSFYPQSDLSGDRDLIVFPSNAQLSARSNGIAGSTLRRCLLALVEAGLISRKDSPNGKRYARKGDEGEIEEAFGFDLAPMLARSEELASLAQQVAADRRRYKVAKERVSLCRRDIRKLLTAAMEEGVPGDWPKAEAALVRALGRMGRTPPLEILLGVADELTLLHQEVINMLEDNVIVPDMTGNGSQNELHIQNSNTDYNNEFEPAQEKEQGKSSAVGGTSIKTSVQTFPLQMILRACPEIQAYGPEGVVESWRDLMLAAIAIRSMLGVSPSAYEEACAVMGQSAAASVMACIFERSGHINSAGGYLRDLTGRAQRGEFSMGPMIMALLRRGQESSVA